MALATPTAVAAIALSFFRPRAAGAAESDLTRHGRRFLRFALAIPLGFFLVVCLRSPVKAYWLGPPLLAGLPPAAEIMWAPALRAWRAARLLDRAWAPTVLILALVFGFGLPYSRIGLPFVPAPAGQIDWRRVAAAVEVLERRVEAQTGGTPLTVVMDSHAAVSELGFYDPDGAIDDITNQQLFGRKGLMFAHWLRGSEAADRPLIVIGVRPSDMAGQGMEEFLAMPERIHQLDLGPPPTPQRFYYRMAHAFTGKAVAENVRQPPS
jgi:dolichol-phosphate mannosyltransferase